MDQTRNFFQNPHVHPVFIAHHLQISVTTIFQRKYTSRIPFSPSLNVGYGYGNGNAQRLTHTKIRSIIVLHLNVQIQISPSILNEDLWSKLECNLRCEIYKNHLSISKIEGVEIWPYECVILDAASFEHPIAKTEAAHGLGRWLEQFWQLSNALGGWFFQLPWMRECSTVGVLRCYGHDWMKTDVRFHLQMKILARTQPNSDEFNEKSEKKVEESLKKKWEKSWNFLFGSEKND